MVAAFAVTVLALLVKRVQDRTKLATLLIFIAIPFTVIFGSMLLDNREFYFISLLVIFETMLPFFLIFENRKPEARELVVIAVVAAIGVVGRAIFFMLPNFKPVTAIVIIAGATLGPEAGFLTGAMTAFVSNFFFGQGPWTPWQMFSFGIIGFLTGILFRKRILTKEKKLRLCIYGAFVSLFIFGLLMDTYTVFTMDFVSSWLEVLAVYASGFPVNCVHAVGTFLFLGVLANPMIEKIERVRTKYGMLDPNDVKKGKKK
ncbi:MAG: ECF transporter S component [Firmicutes bacterium]|nr:ECF transporter S component [Bacillota bacterium]